MFYQGNESLVAKTTVTVPAGGGPIEAVTTVEAVPYWTRSRRKTGKLTSLSFIVVICESASAEQENICMSH